MPLNTHEVCAELRERAQATNEDQEREVWACAFEIGRDVTSTNFNKRTPPKKMYIVAEPTYSNFSDSIYVRTHLEERGPRGGIKVYVMRNFNFFDSEEECKEYYNKRIEESIERRENQLRSVNNRQREFLEEMRKEILD